MGKFGTLRIVLMRRQVGWAGGTYLDRIVGWDRRYHLERKVPDAWIPPLFFFLKSSGLRRAVPVAVGRVPGVGPDFLDRGFHCNGYSHSRLLHWLSGKGLRSWRCSRWLAALQLLCCFTQAKIGRSNYSLTLRC